MITAQDLLTRAEFLSNENAEIAWRESIKHSYYSVYHKLKFLLDSHDVEIINGNFGKHQSDIERLKKIDNRIAHSLARDIQILKDKRVLSCYYLNQNISRLQAKQQVRECINAINKLDKLNNELNL